MTHADNGQPLDTKKKILVFCDAYLPGTQGGGGVWTIVNLVERFHDRYQFFVVTRDRDSRSRRSYEMVKTGEWNDVGNASVFYAADRDVKQSTFARLAGEVSPDAIFLNSLMSTPCVKLLAARRQGKMREIPVIVAPCGELSPGALAGKKLKKKAYLATARATGLFADVIWKATTETEADEIRRQTGARETILIAADLTPKTILADFDATSKPEKLSGSLRLIFYSRIVQKKNLRFLLEVLQNVKSGDIRLEIVGPAEDESYWRACESLIRTLPRNVVVENVGGVTWDEGLRRLVNSHVFALPTLGENFGYVLIESLAAGTPVLASDNVVWTDLESHNAGRLISLEKQDEWRREIERYVAMDNAEYTTMSAAARRYAVAWLARPELEEAMAKVLSFATGGGR